MRKTVKAAHYTLVKTPRYLERLRNDSNWGGLRIFCHDSFSMCSDNGHLSDIFRTFIGQSFLVSGETTGGFCVIFRKDVYTEKYIPGAGAQRKAGQGGDVREGEGEDNEQRVSEAVSCQEKASYRRFEKT
jgi:hypothetical protein